MPTITTANLTAPVSTTVTTQPSQDARRMAAIAKIEGRAEATSTDASNIVQDAPGRVEEPTPAPAPATPPEDEASKAHLERLAAREKQAWAQIKQLKAEKASLEAEKASVQGRLTKEEVVQLLKTDPSKLGLTYEDIGQLYLQGNAPVDPTVARLQAQIEELKGAVTQTKTAAEEQTKAAYAQALKQIDQEAKALVAENPAYEVIRSQGAENAITKLIELTFQEDGVFMGVEEAAAQVEAHLEAEAISLFNKSAKLKAKLMPEAAKSTEAQSSPTAQTRTARTLTPEMAQASAKPLDRKQRAILAFQGKLKD